MKNKFLWAFLCLGLLLVYFNCETDDAVVNEKQQIETDNNQPKPIIKSVTYNTVGSKFSQLKNQFELDEYLQLESVSNTLARETIDTLGITIYIDDIKEITVDDYTSYTMRIVLPDSDSDKFYNLTIEDKNGVEAMFMTKYTPTEEWKNDKSKPYEGNVKTARIDVITNEFPPDGGGEVGSNNSNNSATYPEGCNGTVIPTNVLIAYPCGCGHWPWQDDECRNCYETPPVRPGYRYETYYECWEYGDGGTDNGSTNTNNNGTGDGDDGVPNPNGPDDGENDGSYTTIVDNSSPEQCDNPPPGDLNGDCVVDIKDCILSGNSPEFCECKANGGSDTDCANECGRLKALSDVPSIKSKLHTLKQDTGNHEKIFRIDINSNTGEYLPSPIIDENNGSNHANISVHHQTTAVVHSHPNSVSYKMFSAPDLLKLAEIGKRIQDFGSSTVSLTNITQIIVFEETPNNYKTFALQFDDAQSLQTLINIFSSKKIRRTFKRDLRIDYESDYNYQTYTDETTITKQQTHLYKLLEEFGLNMTIYEANFNPQSGYIDSWDKVDKNDTTLKTPCN